MRQILALAIKDLKLLVRDKAGLFFTFFFPILYAVFFGTIFGGAGGGGSATPLLVIDQDQSAGSAAFVESLDAEEQIAVTFTDDLAAAEEAVRKGDKTAFIVIPEGFGDASIFRGDPMRLIIGVDPSRQAEAGLIKGLVTGKAYEHLQKLFLDPDSAKGMTRDALDALEEDPDLSPLQRTILRTFLSGLDTFLEDMPATGAFDAGGEGQAQAFNPIEIEEAELLADEDSAGPSPFAISFPQGMIWGIMGCAAGFGISLVAERNGGTLTRLRTAPLARSRVLMGKGLACFVTTTGVAVMLLLIARVGFGVVPGSLPLLALAIVSVSLAFVGIMMLLSTIGKTEASSGGIGWAVLLVFAMFGGGMLPLFLMKGWMITLSHVSPVKWSILAIEGAVWRGFTLGDMLLPCGILCGVGVVGFGLGSRLFDWTEH